MWNILNFTSSYKIHVRIHQRFLYGVFGRFPIGNLNSYEFNMDFYGDLYNDPMEIKILQKSLWEPGLYSYGDIHGLPCIFNFFIEIMVSKFLWGFVE